MLIDSVKSILPKASAIAAIIKDIMLKYIGYLKSIFEIKNTVINTTKVRRWDVKKTAIKLITISTNIRYLGFIFSISKFSLGRL